MEAIDLVIIGAGPAGISTALHLLQADDTWVQRMLVLEKESHPRFKLCGGGVTQFGLKILNKLDIPNPLPIPHAEVNDARLIYRDRIIHARKKPQFHVFHRPEFDAYLSSLARNLGVRIQEDEEVTEIKIDEDGVDISSRNKKYRAQAVVGADGALGITRKKQSHHLLKKKKIARSLELTRPAKIDSPLFCERYANFDFNAVQDHLQGYLWEFPSFIGGIPFFNNGIYDSRIVAHAQRAHLKRLLDAGLNAHLGEQTTPKPKAHPIPLFSPRQSFSIPRMLYVGDAAGVDPLFGEGIGPALGYGQVASKSILSAFKTGDFTFKHYRTNILFSHLGRYLILRWAAAWWGYRLGNIPIIMHSVWTLGTIIAKLAETIQFLKKVTGLNNFQSTYDESE